MLNIHLWILFSSFSFKGHEGDNEQEFRVLDFIEKIKGPVPSTEYFENTLINQIACVA